MERLKAETYLEVIDMKDPMWRLFKETGLTQAYMLYRHSQRESGEEKHERDG